jgi:hypothetical protein
MYMIWYDMVWYDMIWYDMIYVTITDYIYIYCPHIFHVSIYPYTPHTYIHPYIYYTPLPYMYMIITLPYLTFHYITVHWITHTHTWTHTHTYIYNNHNCIYIWYHLIISPPKKSKTIDICKIIQHHTAKHTAISAKAIWAALPAALLRGVGDIRYVLL